MSALFISTFFSHLVVFVAPFQLAESCCGDGWAKLLGIIMSHNDFCLLTGAAEFLNISSLSSLN